MAITRVTQNMMTRGSVNAMQTSLSRLAKLQEQLSTGRVLNRPSIPNRAKPPFRRPECDSNSRGYYGFA